MAPAASAPRSAAAVRNAPCSRGVAPKLALLITSVIVALAGKFAAIGSKTVPPKEPPPATWALGSATGMLLAPAGGLLSTTACAALKVPWFWIGGAVAPATDDTTGWLL